MNSHPQLVQTWISVEDYLAGELLSETNHEYDDGEVVAMTGASLNHHRIAGNDFGELRNHFRNKTCEPFTSDVKVKVGKYLFYPDAMVVGDGLEVSDYYTEMPVLIVEVLSKSSRRRDETLNAASTNPSPVCRNTC